MGTMVFIHYPGSMEPDGRLQGKNGIREAVLPGNARSGKPGI